MANLRTHAHLERIFLTCTATNKTARQFYEHFGFQRCGIRRHSIKWQGVYDDEIEYVLVL